MIVGKRNGSIFISTVISSHKATDWKSNPCTWSQGNESGCHNWFNEIKLKLKKKKKQQKKPVIVFRFWSPYTFTNYIHFINDINKLCQCKWCRLEISDIFKGKPNSYRQVIYINIMSYNDPWLQG